MPSPAPPPSLVHRLEQLLDAPVEVVLTRNRSRLVSAQRRPGGGWAIRLHEALATLTDDESAVVAAFARGTRGARTALRGLLRDHAEALEAGARPRRLPRLVPVGRVHDLRGLLAEVRDRWFPHLTDVSITWSGAAGRARRRLRLGSWIADQRLIRIHRRLDEEDVPRFFVASVVHHELCHAELGTPELPGGRRQVHGPDFRRLEGRFPDHERAEAWERANLQRLLAPSRSRRGS